MNHFLKYPYVNEKGGGCHAIVKKIGLYVQCNKKCKDDNKYCNVCRFNFNIINIEDRIVGGFKNKKPMSYDTINCYKQTLKKHGLTIPKIKKEAKKYNVSLNMEFIDEVKKPKKSRKKKKEQPDVSIVCDTSSDEEEETIVRGRGRPRKINEKNKDDLIRDISNEEPELSEQDDYSDDSDDEVLAEIFNYTGNQERYKNMSLYINIYSVVYNNLFEEIGTFNEERNIIIDTI